MTYFLWHLVALLVALLARPETGKPDPEPATEPHRDDPLTVHVGHFGDRLMVGLPDGDRVHWYMIPAIPDADIVLPSGDTVGLVKAPPGITVREDR